MWWEHRVTSKSNRKRVTSAAVDVADKPKATNEQKKAKRVEKRKRRGKK